MYTSALARYSRIQLSFDSQYKRVSEDLVLLSPATTGIYSIYLFQSHGNRLIRIKLPLINTITSGLFNREILTDSEWRKIPEGHSSS